MIVIHAVLSFDGTTLLSIVDGEPRLIFRCIRGLVDGYESRGVDTVIPSAPGRIARNRVRDRIPIELEGEVFGSGADESAQRTDIAAALVALRALFASDRDPATLIVELEDGGTAQIEARPLNIVQVDRTIPTYAKLSVELEAVGADWVIS